MNEMDEQNSNQEQDALEQEYAKREQALQDFRDQQYDEIMQEQPNKLLLFLFGLVYNYGPLLWIAPVIVAIIVFFIYNFGPLLGLALGILLIIVLFMAFLIGLSNN